MLFNDIKFTKPSGTHKYQPINICNYYYYFILCAYESNMLTAVFTIYEAIVPA